MLKQTLQFINDKTSKVKRWRVYICGGLIFAIQIAQSFGLLRNIQADLLVTSFLGLLTLLFRLLADGPAPGYKEIFGESPNWKPDNPTD